MSIWNRRKTTLLYEDERMRIWSQPICDPTEHNYETVIKNEGQVTVVCTYCGCSIYPERVAIPPGIGKAATMPVS